MPINDLVVTFGNDYAPNGTKLFIGQPVPVDADPDLGTPAELRYVCAIRSNNATGVIHCQWEMFLRDGESLMAERQSTPPANTGLHDVARYVTLSLRQTPTGYTDALNAWKAGNTRNVRYTAFKAHLFTAGHLGPGLATS
jgi:hypothetical protein